MSDELIEGLEFFLEGLFGAQADVSPEEIGDRANASVSKAVDYFRRQGFDLGYTPTVKYTEELCRFNANATAGIDADLDFMRNVLGLVGATSLKTVYERLFELKISDEALKETVKVVRKELEAMFPDGILGDDADIFLFKPIQYTLKDLDELMVHEVWHLIERKYGVLDEAGFIHEGTATYVKNRFAGRPSEWSGVETDYFGMVYDNTAYLVQEEVDKEANPLQAILEPERRKSIQKRFEERVLPLFYQKVAELLESGATRNFERDLISNHPAYEDFRKNPDRDNLLKAYRQRGYVKLADELSKQDMREMVEYNQELLS